MRNHNTKLTCDSFNVVRFKAVFFWRWIVKLCVILFIRHISRLSGHKLSNDLWPELMARLSRDRTRYETALHEIQPLVYQVQVDDYFPLGYLSRHKEETDSLFGNSQFHFTYWRLKKRDLIQVRKRARKKKRKEERKKEGKKKWKWWLEAEKGKK